MLDFIGEILFEVVLKLVLRAVLYPAALVFCTPFILVRALVLALRRRQRFRYAVEDGYDAVSDAWWEW
jgi:ABC-type uncharacterized transport system permease subunit